MMKTPISFGAVTIDATVATGQELTATCEVSVVGEPAQRPRLSDFGNNDWVELRLSLGEYGTHEPDVVLEANNAYIDVRFRRLAETSALLLALRDALNAISFDAESKLK